jgi:hypothetical protein
MAPCSESIVRNSRAIEFVALTESLVQRFTYDTRYCASATMHTLVHGANGIIGMIGRTVSRQTVYNTGNSTDYFQIFEVSDV